jgi:hypothetical protein
MVRLLVEEARDALPLPNHPQRRRNDRFLISTSTAGALPRSGSSNRSTVKGVSARPSSFLSILVRPNAGYRVVYAVDAMIAAG